MEIVQAVAVVERIVLARVEHVRPRVWVEAMEEFGVVLNLWDFH